MPSVGLVVKVRSRGHPSLLRPRCSPACTLSSCSHYSVCFLPPLVCPHACSHRVTSSARAVYLLFCAAGYNDHMSVCVSVQKVFPLACLFSVLSRAYRPWSSSSAPQGVPVNAKMLAQARNPSLPELLKSSSSPSVGQQTSQTLLRVQARVEGPEGGNRTKRDTRKDL